MVPLVMASYLAHSAFSVLEMPHVHFEINVGVLFEVCLSLQKLLDEQVMIHQLLCVQVVSSSVTADHAAQSTGAVSTLIVL